MIAPRGDPPTTNTRAVVNRKKHRNRLCKVVATNFAIENSATGLESNKLKNNSFKF